MTRSAAGRCIAFDLDDTLCDEIDAVASGFAAAAATVPGEVGMEVGRFLEACVQEGALSGAFQRAVGRFSLAEDAVARMVSAYRTHEPAVTLRPGMAAVLKRAHSAGGGLVCITDGRSGTQRAKLRKLGVHDLFDMILVSEETGHTKPDPWAFEEVMRKSGAAQFVYVGDNAAKDFVAPNKLSWLTIGVQNPRGLHASGSEVPAGGDPAIWVPDAAGLGAVLFGAECA